MRDLTQYTDQELSLNVFNDEYFYNERFFDYSYDYLIALINEEFIYTPEQMAVLISDLDDDLLEELAI